MAGNQWTLKNVRYIPGLKNLIFIGQFDSTRYAIEFGVWEEIVLDCEGCINFETLYTTV